MARIDDWHKLPLRLRQRFWAETDYDTKPASPELLRIRLIYPPALQRLALSSRWEAGANQ